MKGLGSVVICLSLLLPACSSGSSPAAGGPGPGPGPGQPPSGQTGQRSLTGVIFGPNGVGIPGVTVVIGNPTQAVTNADGEFIILDPPLGMQEVVIDGSTGSGAGAVFPELHVMMVIGEGENVLDAGMTLPDLLDPAAANGNADVQGGTVMQELDAQNGNLGIIIPQGTALALDGQPADGLVPINVTPVPADNVPMPLPSDQNLDPAGFVTVQPANMTIDNGGDGADIMLPNTRGLPPGTNVDVWSFDHDIQDWVNRTSETGNQGVVDASGNFITAPGVITEGGWHVAVTTTDPGCVTTVTGRIVDQIGNPIPRSSIGTGLGQFGRSATDGTFSITSVPAYDPATVPAPCTAIDLTLKIVTPLGFGAVSVTRNVAANSIVQGGTTNVGDIIVNVPTTGSVVGRVVNNGAPVIGGTVTLAGPTPRSPVTDNFGGFFQTRLQAGAYTASFQFPEETDPTVVAFTIVANQTTTINVARGKGTGTDTVDVLVLFDEDDDIDTPGVIIGGAQVLLAGSDAGSAAGLLGTTNDQGIVRYTNVTPPYTVTGQFDRVFGGDDPGVGRFAATLFGITPAGNLTGNAVPTIGLFVPCGADDDSQIVADATVDGTISNLPALGPNDSIRVEVRSHGEEGSFATNVVANPDGTYSVPAPSNKGVLNVGVSHTVNNVTVAAILDFSTGTPPANGTLVRNYDFNNAIDFDQTIDLDFVNTPLGDQFTSIFINDQSADRLSELSFNAGNLVLFPASLDVPAPAALNGPRTNLGFSVDAPTGEHVECEFFVDVIQDVTITFPDLPSVTTPANNASLTLGEMQTLFIDFDEGQGGPAFGLNTVFVEIDEGTGIPGIDIGCWSFLLPKGVTSFTIPQSPLPMFAADQMYRIEVSILRSDTNPGAFGALFNQNVNDNLFALFDGFLCDAQVMIEVATDG